MRKLRIVLWLATLIVTATLRAQTEHTSMVSPLMGCASGKCLPHAAMPFGMVELAPDNFTNSSGYEYSRPFVVGFTHTHKNGGGGCDFQDISFMPITDSVWHASAQRYPNLRSAVSHDADAEHWEPGYYRLHLLSYDILAELTATPRCGIHRYTYPEGQTSRLAIDLNFGCQHSCTIWPDEDFDTVLAARLEIPDRYTVRGYRISHGWCPEQHVYFSARFSKPIRSLRLYDQTRLTLETDDIRDISLSGRDVRVLLEFADDDASPLEASVGISPVSIDGAERNRRHEAGRRSFDQLRRRAHLAWEKELGAVGIDDAMSPQKQVFYTCLYYALLYPQLYCDVDGRYRSSDRRVHRARFPYYAGVLGLWDTFRAQNPLITLLHPEVMNSLMRTFLEHYRHCGQLPIWTLGGQENMCMIGYHAMPVIADAYRKGVRRYDAEALFQAMKASASRDTFGYFLKDYRGSVNYLRYHYVPCDKEITSVSKTLEYCYDDWCIAQMARMLGHEDDRRRYEAQSQWYRNLFDPQTLFMRGRDSQGRWRTPFDPHYSNHYRPDDDFCEGTAWQWTFFVPHDGPGLISLFGGRERFLERLDSLFTTSSELRGEHVAADISGLIGQYAHGNEPSHHIAYMYNYAGEPWRAQQRLSQIMYTLYDPSPWGFCGDEDTGQMSSWFVISAMGFYPLTHGDGRYAMGTPLFRRLTLRHARGTLTVLAPEASRSHCYVRAVTLNGQPHPEPWFTHEELFDGNVTLHFQMSDTHP